MTDHTAAADMQPVALRAGNQVGRAADTGAPSAGLATLQWQMHQQRPAAETLAQARPAGQTQQAQRGGHGQKYTRNNALPEYGGLEF